MYLCNLSSSSCLRSLLSLVFWYQRRNKRPLKKKNQHLNLPQSWHSKNKTLLQCFHSQAHTNVDGFQRIQEQIIQTVDQKKSKHKTSGDGKVKFTGNNMKSIFSQQSNNCFVRRKSIII